MGVEIRQADLDRELPLLADTFNANFPGKPGSRERFQWLYFDNPDGRATAWFAVDDRTGDIAGCTAVLPRRVRVGGVGRVVTAWNCSDFCINPAYRTMGVAIKLRRAAREAVDGGTCAFLYAHPNDRMLQVHLRVGHRPLGTMIRFAKVLRPRMRSPVLRSAGRAFLRFAGKEVIVRRRYDAEVIDDAAIPADIGIVYEAAAGRIGTSVVREQPYLDWRFRRHPMEPAKMLVIRQAGKPVAYAAYTIRDDVATLKDWLAADDTARDQLFAALLRRLRGADVASVTVTALESHPDISTLQRFGFIQRPERSTAITYSNGGVDPGAVTSPSAWYMTFGDRDV